MYLRSKSCQEKENLSFELILVDDNSTDNSWNIIVEMGKKDKRVKGIKLSRNFGQHKAITAGLAKASGKWIVVMDCDLQDQPEEIPKLYAKAREGYDVVLGRRTNRQDGFFERIFSKLFYRVLGYLTDTKQDSTIGNFGIYKQKVIEAVLSMDDNLRYFPAMVK